MSLEARITELLGRMTLEEKISLLSGQDMRRTRAVDRLGIPSMWMVDGPHVISPSGERKRPATCFPTGVSQAGTWNVGLVEEVGGAIAREARARGYHVHLGPAPDVQRSPLNGRHSESFSEDPHLTARMTVAFVRGVQGEGIGSVVKHCCAYTQQAYQPDVSVEVDERTLREVYLPPFEAAVREVRPWGIMTSYNQVNGEPTSECAHAIRDILKGEWGFDGFVVCDWRATFSTRCAEAGLDLEMPGPGKFMTVESLRPLVESGAIPLALIHDKVRRLLRAILRSDASRPPDQRPAGELDSPRHRELARRVAEEAIVLLKNDRGALPLDSASIRRLAVIGPNAREMRLSGCGSAAGSPFYSVGPLEGLKARCGGDVEIVFAEGCTMRGAMPPVEAQQLRPAGGGPQDRGLAGEYFANTDFSGEPVLRRVDPNVDFGWREAPPGEGVPKDGFSVRWTGTLAAPEAGLWALGLTWTGGGARLYLDGELLIDGRPGPGDEPYAVRHFPRDRIVEVLFEQDTPRELRLEYQCLPDGQAEVRLQWRRGSEKDRLDEAVRAAAGADAAVVFVGTSNLYEGGTRDRERLDLPAGQPELIRAVAAANPRTVVVLINGSPVAMDGWHDRAAAIVEAWFPGQEGGNALARLLWGDVNFSARLPVTLPRRLEDNPSYGNFPGDGKTVRLKEGVFVGYRHYDRRGIEPLYPFGFGLSYTRFEYRNLRIETGRGGAGGDVSVSVDVANAGPRAGKEVVQLYVGDVECRVPRPPRELKAFRKIDLSPGETATVRFVLGREAFAFFDPEQGRWAVEAGEFEITVGPHSRGGLTGRLILPTGCM